MDASISNDYLNAAIDELVGTLGIKEEPTTNNFLELLEKNDTQTCIKKIAEQLGLDIEINLTFVSKDYEPNNPIKFESKQLSRTDSKGHGYEGITAQVLIPSNLPLYGTTKLKGFPIYVKVSENCNTKPYTFISIMAHELSHILLHSLYHPKKDNEIYTDLCPMILGFSKIIETGRKNYEPSENGTNITTYGYLTDKQFEFAWRKIMSELNKNVDSKTHVLDMVTQNQNLISSIKKDSCRIKSIINYLDRHQKRKIKAQDVQKIVQFHSIDYLTDINANLNKHEKNLEEVKNYLTQLIHYTNKSDTVIQGYREKMYSLSIELKTRESILLDDLKILVRNVGVDFRIINYLFRKQLKPV